MKTGDCRIYTAVPFIRGIRKMKNMMKNAIMTAICLVAVWILWSESPAGIQMDSGGISAETEAARETEAVSFPKTCQKKISDSFQIDAEIIVPEGFDPGGLHTAEAAIKEVDKEKWKERFLSNGMEHAEYQEISNGATTRDMLKQELKGLGIDSGQFAVSHCVALDHGIQQREEKKLLENGEIEPGREKGDWSGKDDAYYFSLQQTDQGLPVFYQGKARDYWDTVYGDVVRSYFGQSGPFDLHVSYLFDITDGTKRLSLAPLETIAAALGSIYGKAVSEEAKTVTKMTLYQYPLRIGGGKYEMIPVWLCKVEGADGADYVPVHAVTGGEVVEME